jgi:drug/metabolite transporter (DMT)-like permease
MLAGIGLFALNDALGKWLVATYSVGELLLIRSGAALLLMLPFVWRAGPAAFAAAPRPILQVARVVLSSLEVAMFFWAVSYLPLADTVTFYLAGPIYVTALSVLLLGERVGWRRWTAVLVGFGGVLLALRPSAASFTLPALIALVGSISFAFVMIVTRLLRETSTIVLVASQIAGTLILGALWAPFDWVTPTLADFLLMSTFGVVSIVALACVNHSLQLAPASVVAPYQYTFILWAVGLGYLVFSDVPDTYTLSGAAVIVAAGLYIFWRERARVEAAVPDKKRPST